MCRSVTPTLTVRHAALYDVSGRRAVACALLKKFHLFSVQHRFCERVAHIPQLQGEKRLVFIQKAEKDFVSLPQIQVQDVLFFHPGEFALITCSRFSREAVCRVETHILHVLHRFAVFCLCHKGNETAETPARQRVAGFLFYFTQQAFLRAFAKFRMAADADPLVLVDIVLFHRAVHHQIAVILFDVAQRCHAASASFFCFFLHL